MEFFLLVVVVFVVWFAISNYRVSEHWREMVCNERVRSIHLEYRVSQLASLVELLSYAEAKANGEDFGLTYTPDQSPPFVFKGVRPEIRAVLQEVLHGHLTAEEDANDKFERLVHQAQVVLQTNNYPERVQDTQ